MARMRRKAGPVHPFDRRMRGQEVHDLAPRYFLKRPAWSLYNMIGPSASGRLLVVSIQQIEGPNWRLVTAYWNSDGRARRVYEG